jgi:hypothetical protein
MALPSFTAERSLYQTSAHYRGTATSGRAEGTVQLAQDPGCMARCQASCVPGCLELFGNARGACLRECRLECLEACPPPPPPPSPCGPGSWWARGSFHCPTCCSCWDDLCQCSQPLCLGPPPPSPCPQGWRWVSGLYECPRCCRDLAGFSSQCMQPRCAG